MLSKPSINIIIQVNREYNITIKILQNIKIGIRTTDILKPVSYD